MKSTFLKNINFEQLVIIFLFQYIGFIYFSIALSNIFLGIAIFTFLLGWFAKGINLNFSKNNILLFIILIIPLLLTVTSVLHSEDMANGTRSIRLRTSVLLVSFILAFTAFNYKIIKTGLYVFSSLSLIATVLTLLKATTFLGKGIILDPDFTFFITPIQHPYFGIYLLIALVSVIEFNLIRIKFLRIVTLIIFVSGIIISTSRLAYILLFFIIIYYSLINLPKKHAILILVTIAIFSGLFISVNEGIQQKFKHTFEYDNSPRLKLWNNAIKVLNNSDNKLLGIGTGDYYKTKQDPYFFKENSTGLYGYDPHSQVFDFFITTGYFGLIVLIGYFLIQVKWILYQNRFAVIIFIIISAFAMTESILNRQFGVQLYSIFIPLIFSKQFKRLQ